MFSKRVSCYGRGIGSREVLFLNAGVIRVVSHSYIYNLRLLYPPYKTLPGGYPIIWKIKIKSIIIIFRVFFRKSSRQPVFVYYVRKHFSPTDIFAEHVHSWHNSDVTWTDCKKVVTVRRWWLSKTLKNFWVGKKEKLGIDFLDAKWPLKVPRSA